MRLFIAIELPDEVKERLRQIESALDRGYKDVSWVKPGSIHLTLKFLGEVGEEDAPALKAALTEAAKGRGPTDITVSGIGAFPGAKSPRVVWAGIKESPELGALAAAIEARCAALGFPAEERPFKPHLTLCRIKSPASGRELARIIAAPGAGIDIDMGFKATGFVLFRSVLNPKGALYSVLERYGLKG